MSMTLASGTIGILMIGALLASPGVAKGIMTAAHHQAAQGTEITAPGIAKALGTEAADRILEPAGIDTADIAEGWRIINRTEDQAQGELTNKVQKALAKAYAD